MITADVYTLLNDIFFEVIRFVGILALVILAIFLGGKLRKLHDRKKSEKDAAAQTMDSVSEDNTDITNNTTV